MNLNYVMSTRTIMLIVGFLAAICLWIIIALMLINNRRNKKEAKETPIKQAETSKSDKDKKKNKTVELAKVFKDKELLEVVATKLEVKPTEKVSVDKLLEVKDLQGVGKNIQDLTGIRQLKNLESINLNDNKIQVLPAEIKELTNLKDLNLSHNKLDNIAQIKDAKTIRALDVSHNNIAQLPKDIGSLTNLEKLVAQHNKLVEIPTELTSAPKLNELDLSHNVLVNLPDSVGNMQELATLNLADNYLTELPVSLGALEKLKKIDVSKNEAIDLPKELNEKLAQKEIELLQDKKVTELTIPETITDSPIVDSETNLQPFETILTLKDLSFDALTDLTENLEESGEDTSMKTINTYIDLTSSNEDLLSEIAALEKTLGDTGNIPVVEETPPTVDVEMTEPSGGIEMKKANQIEEVIELKEKELEETIEAIEQDVNALRGKEEEDMGEFVEVRTVEEAMAEKKAKRNKIIRIASIVAGTTVAVVAAAGTGAYLYQKNKKTQVAKKASNRLVFKRK